MKVKISNNWIELNNSDEPIFSDTFQQLENMQLMGDIEVSKVEFENCSKVNLSHEGRKYSTYEYELEFCNDGLISVFGEVPKVIYYAKIN